MPSLTGTGAAVYAASQKADSSLSVGSGTASVTLGNSALYVVSVSGSNGFKSPVTLSVSGLPAGTTATFARNPNLLTTSVLTVVTTAASPLGSFTLTINATSGTLSHSLTVQLTITAPLTGFALSVSPSSVATPAGTVANYTVTITRSPLFTGAVAPSLAGAPPARGGTSRRLRPPARPRRCRSQRPRTRRSGATR